MRQLLGRPLWEKLFTFTIARNPWDRTLSFYNLTNRNHARRGQDFMSFRDYVLALRDAVVNKKRCGPFTFSAHRRRLASDYITDKKGEVLVNYIARYENREHDLQYIASRIGLPGLGKLYLNKANPEKEHYSCSYDDETQEIVRTLCAKDIQLFGYEFEDK